MFSFKSKSFAYLQTFPSNSLEEQEFHIFKKNEKDEKDEEVIIQRLISFDSPLLSSTSSNFFNSSSLQGINKLQSFFINYCEVNSINSFNILNYLQFFFNCRERSFSLILDLGLNSTIWLIGRHLSYDIGDLLIRKNKELNLQNDYFSITSKELYQKLESLITTTKEYFRLNYKVKIKCYEIYAEQIRDLLSTNESINSPYLRENKSIPYVESLIEKECFNSNELYETIRSAYLKRLSLVVEYLGLQKGLTIPILERKFIGYVGNVFIHVEVSQTLCSTSTEMMGDHTNNKIIQRTGTIQYNILADTEALAYKTLSKTENLTVVLLQQFWSTSDDQRSSNLSNSNGSIISMNESTISTTLTTTTTTLLSSTNPSLINNTQRLVSQQLSLSAKALSTLSRVVSALYSRQNQTTANEKYYHISYRDSILTRVLQSSLEGYAANYICLFHDLRKDNGTSSDLSLSPAVSCGTFLRLMTELQGSIKTSTFMKSSDVYITTMTKTDLQNSIERIQKQTLRNAYYSSNDDDDNNNNITKLSNITSNDTNDTEDLTNDSNILTSREIEQPDNNELNNNNNNNNNNNIQFNQLQSSSPQNNSNRSKENISSIFWSLLASLKNDSTVSSIISSLINLEEERERLLLLSCKLSWKRQGTS